MKRAFLLTPLIVAVVFAIPEALQQISNPGPGYVPVINELLLLLFAYLAALLINACLIVPLSLLVKMKSSSLIVGIGLALLTSLIGTTVGYAFEIFDYQSSIFHPAYLYTLLIPLFVMTVTSFFFLTHTRPKAVVSESGKPAAGAGSDADAGNAAEE